jgi:hypothetical protein
MVAPALKILVHFIDGLIHSPREMFVHFEAGDGKGFWYRTFAVEKYEVAENILRYRRLVAPRPNARARNVAPSSLQSSPPHT